MGDSCGRRLIAWYAVDGLVAPVGCFVARLYNGVVDGRGRLGGKGRPCRKPAEGAAGLQFRPDLPSLAFADSSPFLSTL